MGQVSQRELENIVPGSMERRRFPRYKCELPVEITMPGLQFPCLGRTTDVSLGGCYISSWLNRAVGTEVELKLWVGDIGVKMKAIIRTSDPGVGNGVEFKGLDETGKQDLSDYLDHLDGMPVSTESSIKDLLIT